MSPAFPTMTAPPPAPAPFLSVVSVVRNGADVVADCLDSVARQTEPCEHVIVDGASTDGTLDLLHAHADRQRAAGRRVVVISEPDHGLYDAMNKGIAAARGEVVGLLNADDMYRDEQVARRVAAAMADPQVDAAYGDLVFVRPSPGGGLNGVEVTRHWQAGEYRPGAFLAGWMPPHPTFFLRRRLYDRHGGYRLDLGTSADYELMLRMFVRCGIRAAYIPEVLVCMRLGGLSTRTAAGRLRANRNDRRAWAVNGLRPHFWTLWAKPLRKLGQWRVKD